MDLIVSHSNADFDAFSSLVAAKKLYPNSKLLLPGSKQRAVREFLSLVNDKIHIEREKTCDLRGIRRLIIVDTRHKSRIGIAAALLSESSVETHIYDHHPRASGDIKADKDVFREVGATVSIIVDLLRKKKRVKFTPLEATIMLLAVYEETGSLTYRTTTRLDVDTVSFLLSKGANLQAISSYLNRKLSEEELTFLTTLISSTKVLTINGINVAIAKGTIHGFIGELGGIVRKLDYLENFPVLFVLFKIKNKLRVMARSRIKEVDVNNVLAHFGGGGHKSAASAKVDEADFETFEKKLINILHSAIKEKVFVRDVMISPVKRVIADKTIADAKRILKKPRISAKMEHALPWQIVNMLRDIGVKAEREGYKAYVVGGFVRDLLLGVRNLDVDIVVEGNAIAFAKRLAALYGGSLVSYKKFGTAAIFMDWPKGMRRPSGSLPRFKLDFATARKESYAKPAALPSVEFSSLKNDLHRRDFTINAMAASLNRASFGRLIDLFGGARDLENGIIKVLHDASFIDDPTRIFRAVRFEQRLGFNIDNYTERLIKHAMREGMFFKTQDQRIRDELMLMLKEEKPIRAILRMKELDELRFIHKNISVPESMRSLFAGIKSEFKKYGWNKNSRAFADLRVVYLMAILSSLKPGEIKAVCEKFVFRRTDRVKLLAFKSRGQKIRSALSLKYLSPSKIYRILEPLSREELIFQAARPGSARLRERIRAFLTAYSKVKIKIGGKDLKKLGMKPGPLYSRILRKALYEKLDGKLKTKKDELEFAKRHVITDFQIEVV
ncbi:MAG: DHHA1 domain-containing protein [Omnitrophica bacterium]|nr:DHHA1 domain-containing protein [Candidatus Omnitrophota bacterium]